MTPQLDSRARKALAETIFWCSGQALTSHSPETSDTIRRRKLMEEAGSILREISGRKNAYKSAPWLQAMDMLGEADPASLVLLGHQLRSPPLRPRGMVGKVFSEVERGTIIAEVILKRSQLVAETCPLDEKHPSQVLGKFLIYEPSENVQDGASEYASNGFYDACDAPPWDIWVRYSNGQLLSWVPTPLIQFAQDGIDANAVDCIRWADLDFA